MDVVLWKILNVSGLFKFCFVGNGNKMMKDWFDSYGYDVLEVERDELDYYCNYLVIWLFYLGSDC